MSYTPTNYEIEGREFNAFFSAHALAKLLSPQKIVALLPDSLIVHDNNTAKDLNILIKRI
jgi:CRISPR/Cas system-associated protein Csx1